MNRIVSAIAACGIAASALCIGAAAADAKDHRHHYVTGSYKFNCVNEEASCGNWVNNGKVN